MNDTMTAWVQRGFGGPDVRVLEQYPRPVPAPDEVLLRVRACGLNRLDILQREAPLVGPFRLPHIGGMDFVGEVVEATTDTGEQLLGETVVVDPMVTCGTCDRCRDGLEVYCHEFRACGSSRAGGLAEYVAVPAANCIPADLGRITAEELACVPVASVTAWHALLVAGGGVSSGETVVIPGAGSGLGIAGIQIAKGQGCTVVTTVAGQHKVGPARELGADLVIDRTATDWVEEALAFTDGRGVEMVWDHVGGPFLQQAIDACRVNGRVVMSGTTAGNDSRIVNSSLFHWGKSIIGHGGYEREELRDTVAAYCNGDLRIVLDSSWPLADYRQAEARLESNDFFGKIVVTP